MKLSKINLRKTKCLTILFLLLFSKANGLENKKTINFKFGYIPMHYTYKEFPEYVISPELGIDSKLLNTEDNILSLYGSFYLFIWDDFIDEPIKRWTDNRTWSITCFGTGIRPKINIKWIFDINIQFFPGISYFYYYRDYIGGEGSLERPDDKRDELWFYELGGNINYKILKRINLIIEYSSYKSIKKYWDHKKHIKIGIQYSVN